MDDFEEDIKLVLGCIGRDIWELDEVTGLWLYFIAYVYEILKNKEKVKN